MMLKVQIAPAFEIGWEKDQLVHYLQSGCCAATLLASLAPRSEDRDIYAKLLPAVQTSSTEYE
jgi:hypothetical protein